MFPIRDHNPSETTPYVVYALIAVNVIVFALQLPYMGDDRALAGFWADRALYPAAVTQYHDYTGIFTSMLLHAGFMHIAGNMLFLWIFGDNLEDQMGHVGFLLFYLASGVAAALAHIAAAPTSTVPTVGASGASPKAIHEVVSTLARRQLPLDDAKSAGRSPLPRWASGARGSCHAQVASLGHESWIWIWVFKGKASRRTFLACVHLDEADDKEIPADILDMLGSMEEVDR